jgi:hypothetical protein
MGPIYIAKLTPFHSSESAAYYDQILQLRAALEKKLSGVAGVR